MCFFLGVWSHVWDRVFKTLVEAPEIPARAGCGKKKVAQWGKERIGVFEDSVYAFLHREETGRQKMQRKVSFISCKVFFIFSC